MIEAQAETMIEGVLESITFTNRENAFSVVRVRVAGEPSEVTAVGSLLGVRCGESLRLRGRWEHHARHGRQFRVASFMPIAPSTLDGIRRYLGSGIVRGVGKELARRLVERFGADTLEVISHASDRLTEVAGIGSVRKEQILHAWSEQTRLRDIMVFLQSHGISSAFAARIYKRYGDASIAAVRENPYRLALDVPGIGFMKADAIAASLGIAKDAPARLDAGLEHVLAGAAESGHLFLVRAALCAEAERLLEVTGSAVAAALERSLAEGRLIAARLADGSEAIYLPALYRAEMRGAARLAAICAARARAVGVDVARALKWFEESFGLRLAAGQEQALRLAVEAKLVVITGGPGTGKTTVLNAIIQVLSRKELRIALAAPTGRAARRMSEATGREAKTIHRLLEFSARSLAFLRNRSNPLEVDLVIIDESSMVDAALFADLLDAVPDACRVIFVGDVDQLPAVGPGNVLRDLIRSKTVPVVYLEQVFRQAETSRIVVNAHRVNRGEMPLVDRSADEGGDFFIIEESEPDRVLERIDATVSERIPKRFGLSPVDEVQVLSPMVRGPLGAANLNRRLQQLLNPAGSALVRGERTYRVGDRVMQLRNNYDLEVFNGDVGRITAVDPEGAALTVAFEEREVALEREDIDDLGLAYAVSIHKAQGSEYPAVVIPIHTGHYVMLQRNLLYTAITRGRRLVVIIGSRRALGIAIRNDSIVARNTRLAELLSGTSVHAEARNGNGGIDGPR
ncbi:MAG: ATP-dependent RecD-like DNA helicase [Planctomycetes bacterium]|nr:ATP-dependent RecD-like DNA helicase [Planctomycetota bacterium]